jgi:hypothetical protein
VTPAAATLYVEAVVRPEGALQTNATTTARALSGRQHPFEGVLKLLAGPTGHAPNYSQEVAPWLGSHASLYINGNGARNLEGKVGEALRKALGEGLTGVEEVLLGQGGVLALIGSAGVRAAEVLDTSNLAQARSFLEGQAHAVGAHTESYRGVTYFVSPNGVAEGIVHRFAVIGDEAGLKEVVDTAAGSPALAQAASYAKLASTAEHEALANAYVDAEGLTRTGGRGTGGAAIVPLVENLLGNPGQVYASLVPSAHAVALDFDTLPSTSPSTSSSTGTTGAEVVRGLPGGSWLAIGFGNFGRAIGSAGGLEALTSLASGVNLGGISFGAAFTPLNSHSLNVQRDLLSWAGPAGLYASGSSLLNLQAALVITPTNPAHARAAVATLARAYRAAGAQISHTSVTGAETAVTVKLASFPLTLTIAYGSGKFVVGVGAPSVQEALNPQTTLGSTPGYTSAASTLGQGIQPSALVEFHTLSGLLEGLGLNQAQGLSGFASAIAPLETLVAGGGETLPGGVKRARVVIGLQASASASG